MIPVYSKPTELERLAKEKYAVPDFLMMENAAKAMAAFILEKTQDSSSTPTLLIACGKGNNGGDGYALARLLQDKMEVTVLCLEEAAATEARAQYEMCKRLGIKLLYAKKAEDLKVFEASCKKATFVVDCIYGTGFRGELSPETSKIIEAMNHSPGLKLACDISSGLAFKADFTLTMGSLKLALFSDEAKAVSGQIQKIEIGISSRAFEEAGSQPQSYLIEASDMQLPLRKNKAAHKGTYGHTAVMCGDKAGAAILAATAAMNFGSGLTSLIEGPESNLSQFKISPSLMIASSLPAKTSCILLGSGFIQFPKEAADLLVEYFHSSKAPAAVLDAGLLTSPQFPDILKELNSVKNARLVLTPHLSELSRLLEELCHQNIISEQIDFSVKALAQAPECRIAAGKKLNELYPRTAVIMKSANSYIAAQGNCFIISDGGPCLAKGGSGDILAGLTAALLAQGYSAKDAAITAAQYHAGLSKQFGEEAFDLTPEKLLSMINK